MSLERLTGPYLYDTLASEHLSEDARIDLDFAFTFKQINEFLNGG